MDSTSNDKSKLKANAQTKLWIEWTDPVDGYPNMTYYSYETPESLRDRDIRFGLGRLIKLLFAPQIMGNYNVARVYHIQTGRPIFEVKNNKVDILQRPLSESTMQAIEANFRKYNYLNNRGDKDKGDSG